MEKRKRGRPRKNPTLPEPILKIIDSIEDKDRKEFLDIVEEERKKRKGNWDITKDDPISFFDRSLSYEISGYRPIDDKHGLDFNPDWFCEARNTFKRTGHYCQFPKGSKAFSDYWTLEYVRCRDGLTVNDYTITGDHYFFLNYYLLANLDTAKAGGGRHLDFPTFYVALYEWFHYLELCKLCRKNAVLMKARGVGFSEMDAALASNTYNCRRLSNTVITARLAKYVEDTLAKAWNALSFLNDYTDGGFFKLRQVLDKQDVKKSSVYKIINGQKVETGFMSQIKGIVADSPNKIRGDRCDVLLYEELGSWDNSIKAFIQGDALVSILGSTFGIKVGGGTGGDSGAKLEGLRTIYYDPEAFNVLPFKHRYTLSGEEVLTAYFIPAFTVVKGEYMDSRGYTNPEEGKKYYNEKRAAFANNPKHLLTYCAEYCFNAEEAFSLEGDNKFNKVAIAELLAQIRLYKRGPKPVAGNLEYMYKNSLHTADNIDGVTFKPHSDSKLLMLEPPIWEMPTKYDEDGHVVFTPPSDPINNLYVIGIDSIDIGARDTSAMTKDPSKFCAVVKKRAYGLENPKYVCMYMDRPSDIREAYKIAIKLAEWYKASINIEATRMNMISWARDNKYLKHFMKRPSATYPDPTRRNINLYGSPATAAVIDHQTTLIADYVNDYYLELWFEDMLDQLNRYNDDNKTKFDIIAAMGMAELADEELHDISPKSMKPREEVFLDIGYYIDEHGYKKYGVIPNNSMLYKPRVNDDWMSRQSDIRTSNPNLL